MTTCSDSFWFWFLRPFAELAGGITLVVVAAVIFVLYQIFIHRNDKSE